MSTSEWLATIYFFFLLMNWVVGPKLMARIQGGNPEAKVENIHIYSTVLLSVIPVLNIVTVYYALVLNVLLKMCDTDKERYELLNELIDEALSKGKRGAAKKDKESKEDSGA